MKFQKKVKKKQPILLAISLSFVFYGDTWKEVFKKLSLHFDWSFIVDKNGLIFQQKICLLEGSSSLCTGQSYFDNNGDMSQNF